MADYCTTTNVKGAGRLNITDTGYDTQLGEMITAASRWIDRFCAGDIVDAFAVAVATTRYYTATDASGGTLFLDGPLLTVTSLTNGDGATLTGSDYRLHAGTDRRVSDDGAAGAGAGRCDDCGGAQDAAARPGAAAGQRTAGAAGATYHS